MRYLYKLVLFFSLCSPLLVKAQGNLLVIPRRVVFEGAKRIQEINLGNSGIDTTKYSISLIQYRMEKDGGFTAITVPDSDQYFADKYVRFFPHTVTLAPNEAQTIKMQVVGAANLKPGEYRSHLYFSALPKVTNQITDKKDTALKKEISIKLVPLIGISIPVILRVGVSNTVTSMSNLLLKYKNNAPFAQVDISRKGNMSVYGDIKVNYISEAGVTTLVGEVKGIAIYTPTPVRTVTIALDPKPAQDLHKGKLYVIYASQPESKQNTKFADAEITLK